MGIMRLQTHFLGIPPFLIGASCLVLVQAHSAVALMPYQISQLAKGVTVRIASQSSGSGVIINQTDDTYTVLTSAHVVETEDNYSLIAPDGKTIEVDAQTIRRLEDIDLAILQFRSKEHYDAVELGDSTQVKEGEDIYISGFPVETLAIDEQVYSFTEGEVIANSTKALSDGYSLVYSNNTLPGMSGGPIFNDEGQLIGIHGRADTVSQKQEATLNPSIWIKTGFNLGIPTNTFLLAIANFAPHLSTRQPVKEDITAFGPTEFFIQGMGRMQSYDFLGAIDSFNEAINLTPGGDFYEVRLKRAYAYVYHSIYYGTGNQERDMGAALLDCSYLIKSAPTNPQGYACRGFVHSYLGNDPEALQDFNRAIALAPKDESFYFDRAELYDRRRVFALAIQDLSRAIDLNPNFVEAYRLRGQVYEALKDFKSAIADYSQAMKLDPNADKYYQLRGEARYNFADYHGAVADFSRLSPPPFESRGKAYVALGNYEKAIADLNQAVANSPYTIGDNGYRYYYRGLAFWKLGKINLAVRDLETAIAGFEELPTIPRRIEEQKARELLAKLKP